MIEENKDDRDVELRPAVSVDPGRSNRWSAASSSGAGIRLATSFIILAIWGASTIASIVSKTYDPPDGINTIALAAATYLFGSALRKENKSG